MGKRNVLAQALLLAMFGGEVGIRRHQLNMHRLEQRKASAIASLDAQRQAALGGAS